MKIYEINEVRLVSKLVMCRIKARIENIVLTDLIVEPDLRRGLVLGRIEVGSLERRLRRKEGKNVPYLCARNLRVRPRLVIVNYQEIYFF